MAQMTKHSIRKLLPSTKVATTLTWITVAAVAAVGCTAVADSDRQPGSAAVVAQAAQAVPAGVAVSCATGQQTLVKQAIVAGQPAVQVECVPMTATGAVTSYALQQPAFAPQAAWAAPPAAVPVATAPIRNRSAVYRPVSDDEIVYQPRARRVERPSGRSWQKSAVIIGSSAGVGAGVGAAISGKKGALIGAAIGGGSAAIWDQVTRRR
jgi:hypothetical protein